MCNLCISDRTRVFTVCKINSNTIYGLRSAAVEDTRQGNVARVIWPRKKYKKKIFKKNGIVFYRTSLDVKKSINLRIYDSVCLDIIIYRHILVVKTMHTYVTLSCFRIRRLD